MKGKLFTWMKIDAWSMHGIVSCFCTNQWHGTLWITQSCSMPSIWQSSEHHLIDLGLCLSKWVSEWLSLTAFLEQRTARCVCPSASTMLVGSDNDLAVNRWKAFIWTNDGLACWRIMMVQLKTAVSPLQMHWNYCSLTRSHWYMLYLASMNQCGNDTTQSCQKRFVQAHQWFSVRLWYLHC